MNVPKTTVVALTATASAMLVPLGIPQDKVEAEVQALLDRVCGKGVKSITPDTMLSAKEVAERIGRCPKTVRLLGKAGKIRRVYCGVGGRRASGYSEKSIEAFLAGKEAV